MQRTVQSSQLTIDWRQSMSIRRRLMTAGAQPCGHSTTLIEWRWGAIAPGEILVRRLLSELVTRVSISQCSCWCIRSWTGDPIRRRIWNIERPTGISLGVWALARMAQESIRHIWSVYIPEARRRSEPYASPFRVPSLESVAPALIINAEHDILREEGEEYACRLRASGVPVKTYTYLGQLHGFFNLLGVMRDSRDAVLRAAGISQSMFSEVR